MTSLLFFAIAAIEAPVTEVTVFADQARIVRTAQLTLTGRQTVEFPPLHDTADQESVRVEARGAEVKRVDIERIEPEKMRTQEAKAVLSEIAVLETELDRSAQIRGALQAQQETLLKLVPIVTSAEPLKPAAQLNSSGWAVGAQFSSEQLSKLQSKLREQERAAAKLTERRRLLVEKANQLGNPEMTSGWKVTAQLTGSGLATVRLTYVVRNAQWTPLWDLQFQPDTNVVSLSLAAVVSQHSGEDWVNATLLLSTAVPMNAAQAPRLATWKIGVTDRFIPTPGPIYVAAAPVPGAPAPASLKTEEDSLREQIARLRGAVSGEPGQPVPPAEKKTSGYELTSESGEGGLVNSEPEVNRRQVLDVGSVTSSASHRSFNSLMNRASADFSQQMPVSTFSLSPPPAWNPPSFGADSPVTLAGGYDLSFTSLQKESVPSGKGSRRVALWSAQWPVTVERKLFPALTSDAFLVAELKNPSSQVLPGGPTQLYVGADPSGTARLGLVSPGEVFTLPLGIDRALKPVRNVQMREETQGVISKEEIGTYVVTTELVNPYRTPISVRVEDQWPVTDQDDVEIKLVESKPTATQNTKKGALEWRVSIAPQQKQVFSFTYTVKRPKGWKLQQQELSR